MILKNKSFFHLHLSLTQVKSYAYRIVLVSLIFLSPACKIYRFTDASVDPNWKTFTMGQTVNVATLQNPNAAPAFTEKIKDKFLRDTRLVLIRESGDLEFSATITEYSIDPVSNTNT